MAGFDMIYACQDFEFDVKMRLRSVPARFGVAAALRLAAAVPPRHGGAVARCCRWCTMASAGFTWRAWRPSAVLLAYEHWLVRPDDLSRVNRAFFHVNAVVSLGLLVVGVVDLFCVSLSDDRSEHSRPRSLRIAAYADSWNDNRADNVRSDSRKVEAGQRLSAADGEFLFSPEVDLHAVGELADLVRRRKNGDAAYYNLNLHLNPTNVCIYPLRRCAPTVATTDDPRAYAMSDGRDPRPRPGGGRRRLHRTAHRRRRASARRRSTGTWA